MEHEPKLAAPAAAPAETKKSRRERTLSIMTFWASAPLLFALQMQLSLPETVEAWRREIEAKLGGPIRIVQTSEDAPELAGYFANPSFQAAMARAQALTLSLRSEGQLRPYVLLNWARLRESANDPAMLFAHELGHIWLQANGYFPPKFNDATQPCLAVHIGDIVQHERIREEMDRRSIDWHKGYQLDYEASLAAARLADRVPAGDACLRAQRLSLMIDIRQSFPAAGNPWRNEYLSLLGRQDPAAEALAIELAESLLESQTENYAEAITKVQEAVIALVARPLD